MPLFQKYKLHICYDGTHYSGWQVQQNSESIQELIQQALSTLLNQSTPIIGSGRTDRGVHALEQIAHFTHPTEVNKQKILNALNGLLPKDIRIHSIEKASPDFHARYSAKRKIYRYHVYSSRINNPFKQQYCYHFPYPLNISLIQKNLSLFLGKRDFTSFSNESHRGSASQNAIRTLYRFDIFQQKEELIFELEADGFLYKMVRNIIGTILEMGRGKILPEQLPLIFHAKDRKQAGPCVPPHGLFLIKVIYENESPPNNTTTLH